MNILDEQLDILSDAHRRRLLAALSNEGPQTVLTDTAIQQGTEKERHAVRMYHHHLPKLEDFGYVRWDGETGTVTKGERFEEIEPLLALVMEVEEERH